MAPISRPSSSIGTGATSRTSGSGFSGGLATVCDAANEACPTFPRPVPKLHLSFFDPAAAEGMDDEKMTVFRRVRDEIRDRLVPEIRRRS